MFEASPILLKRDRFDDLCGVRGESRHYTPKVNTSLPACQVVVPTAAVVVQVDMNRSSLFQEWRQVAIHVGM
ncbi:MAG: hypothetical protein WC093_09530, partial [Methanoculleus sp.]